MNCHIDKLVLGFSLNQSRPLRPRKLNYALDVDLIEESVMFQLVNYHVNDYQCSSATDASATMNDEWAMDRSLVDILEKT